MHMVLHGELFGQTISKKNSMRWINVHARQVEFSTVKTWKTHFQWGVTLESIGKRGLSWATSVRLLKWIPELNRWCGSHTWMVSFGSSGGLLASMHFLQNNTLLRKTLHRVLPQKQATWPCQCRGMREENEPLNQFWTYEHPASALPL